MYQYFLHFAERYKNRLISDPVDTETSNFLDWYYSIGIYRNNKPSPYRKAKEIDDAKAETDLHSD